MIKKDTQKEWESIYSAKSFRHKNKYPFLEIVSFIMRNFGNRKNKKAVKILDLGCGWGNNLNFLKSEGFDYYGIDFSKSAVKNCQKFYKNVICGDMTDLPYESDFFDCVFDRMAIQHNPKEKIAKIFDEVFRVLKPRGLFFSALTSQAKYDLGTSYLSKKEILKLAGRFSGIKLDYVKSSWDNDLSLVYYLSVKK